MAARARKASTSGEIELVVGEGTCGDGCGEQVAKGRSFKQGHDARLKSILGRAHKAGQMVKVNGETATPEALLVARNWPVPAIPAPKPTEDGYDKWARENGLPKTVLVDGDEVVVKDEPKPKTAPRPRATKTAAK